MAEQEVKKTTETVTPPKEATPKAVKEADAPSAPAKSATGIPTETHTEGVSSEEKVAELAKQLLGKKAKKKKKEPKYIYIKNRKIPLNLILIPFYTATALAILIPLALWVISEQGFIEIGKSKDGEPVVQEPKAQTNPEGYEKVYFVETEQFVVTLETTTGMAYLKLKLTIEVVTEEIKAELEGKMPQVRDAIVGVISERKLSDVNTTLGKLRLKDDVRKKINSFLTSGKATDVYFTEFIFQT